MHDQVTIQMTGKKMAWQHLNRWLNPYQTTQNGSSSAEVITRRSITSSSTATSVITWPTASVFEDVSPKDFLMFCCIRGVNCFPNKNTCFWCRERWWIISTSYAVYASTGIYRWLIYGRQKKIGVVRGSGGGRLARRVVILLKRWQMDDVVQQRTIYLGFYVRLFPFFSFFPSLPFHQVWQECCHIVTFPCCVCLPSSSVPLVSMWEV